MKGIIKVSGLTFIAFIIQTALYKYIDIFGVIPDIVFVIVLCYCLSCESENRALLFAGICGIIMDLLWGRIFGVYTLLFAYSAVVCFVFVKLIFNRGTVIATMFTFVMSICFLLIYYFVSFVLWGDTGFVFVFLRIIVPTAIYNSALAIVIYPMVDKFVLSDIAS